MSEAINQWGEVLGPFYSDNALTRRGVEVNDALITLTTADGVTIYPHTQFNTLPDETLQPREAVLALWNNLIRPAITEGIIDEWTATGLLLQETPEHPSRADIIASDPTQVERVASSLAQAMARLRQ